MWGRFEAPTIRRSTYASQFQQLVSIPPSRSFKCTLGLQASKGLLVSEAFYWDLNDGTRALTERYAPQVGGAKPCTIQAGCYSGVLHYLKAVAAGAR